MDQVLILFRELATILEAACLCFEQLRHLVKGDEATPPPGDSDNGTDASDVATFGDDFLYDTVARMNETVVGNIDTADLALLAVVGGTLAVLVFGIDKIRELSPPWEICSYWLLGSSVTVCTGGYLIGFGSQREPLDPGSFTLAFADAPDEAISTAIEDAVLVYQMNSRIRLLKRIGVATALSLLVAGTVVAALARSIGAVV